MDGEGIVEHRHPPLPVDEELHAVRPTVGRSRLREYQSRDEIGTARDDGERGEEPAVADGALSDVIGAKTVRAHDHVAVLWTQSRPAQRQVARGVWARRCGRPLEKVAAAGSGVSGAIGGVARAAPEEPTLARPVLTHSAQLRRQWRSAAAARRTRLLADGARGAAVDRDERWREAGVSEECRRAPAAAAPTSRAAEEPRSRQLCLLLHPPSFASDAVELSLGR